MYAGGRFNAPGLRQLRREAVSDAKRRLANVARRKGNGHLRHTVPTGIPYSEIVEKAVHIKASVIVMGNRGAPVWVAFSWEALLRKSFATLNVLCS
jgi:nucleotide-binding universal stress UspA family protein